MNGLCSRREYLVRQLLWVFVMCASGRLPYPKVWAQAHYSWRTAVCDSRVFRAVCCSLVCRLRYSHGIARYWYGRHLYAGGYFHCWLVPATPWLCAWYGKQWYRAWCFYLRHTAAMDSRRKPGGWVAAGVAVVCSIVDGVTGDGLPHYPEPGSIQRCSCTEPACGCKARQFFQFRGLQVSFRPINRFVLLHTRFYLHCAGSVYVQLRD